MAIVAAFHWTKSPKMTINYLIFDEDDMSIYTLPQQHVLPRGFFRFRSAAKELIKDFFSQIIKIHQIEKKQTRIEFKIVCPVTGLAYLSPSRESKYVRHTFLKYAEKTKKIMPKLKICPQLKSKLSGKALKYFKREFRKMELVARKRDSGYQYHLWTVALHATEATYEKKLKKIKKILLDAMWNQHELAA